MKAAIVGFAEDNNLLQNFQHRFRTGRSCLTQLIDYYNSIMEQLELGESVEVVDLVMAKAFDKVDHKILMNKIKSLGISSKVLKWLHCFLENRYQIEVISSS